MPYTKCYVFILRVVTVSWMHIEMFDFDPFVTLSMGYCSVAFEARCCLSFLSHLQVYCWKSFFKLLSHTVLKVIDILHVISLKFSSDSYHPGELLSWDNHMAAKFESSLLSELLILFIYFAWFQNSRDVPSIWWVSSHVGLDYLEMC